VARQDIVERAAVIVAERTSRRGVIARAGRLAAGIVGGSAVVAARSDTAHAARRPADDTAGIEITGGNEEIKSLVSSGCCYCWSSCTCSGALTKRLRLVYCCPCCACTNCPSNHTVYTKCTNYAC